MGSIARNGESYGNEIKKLSLNMQDYIDSFEWRQTGNVYYSNIISLSNLGLSGRTVISIIQRAMTGANTIPTFYINGSNYLSIEGTSQITFSTCTIDIFYI